MSPRGRLPQRRPGRGGTIEGLPVRGPRVRELALPLPQPDEPAAGTGAADLPLMRRGRPLKRWRYVGAFGPELMLCAGDARIGPLRQRWWAIAEPGGALYGRTSTLGGGLSIERRGRADPGSGDVRVSIADRGVRVELTLVEGVGCDPVEVVSPSGAEGWAWTRKQAGLPAHAVVEIAGGRRRELELRAVVDDSLGYHQRRTAWHWTTGVGLARSGEQLAWNLVSGVHDSTQASERTLWVDGKASELAPASFAADLSGVELADGAHLGFRAWATREHRVNLGLVRSAYRQPFGTFSGTLPGGVELAEGFGVMEEHDVRW